MTATLTATLDTNTLASGAVAPPGGTLATLIDAFLTERFRIVLSEPIDRELERALQKPYFARRLSLELRMQYLTAVRSVAIPVPITVEVHGIATHPEDDLVLATALSAAVPYPVTGDIPFLPVYRITRECHSSPRGRSLMCSSDLTHDPHNAASTVPQPTTVPTTRPGSRRGTGRRDVTAWWESQNTRLRDRSGLLRLGTTCGRLGLPERIPPSGPPQERPLRPHHRPGRLT